MIIVNVSLENYRIHKSYTVSFDKKINLLLGQNGSGKSSILEAIGFALFDAPLRSTNGDAISRGEKSALIKVTFKANDGNIYRVDRKIGSGQYHRFYIDGEKKPRLEGKDSVVSKVKEISGIKSNEKEIYQNIITAYQNKIIGIFNEKPGNRERAFNQIFDTAIYRKIYEEYLKDFRDDISDKKNRKEDLLKEFNAGSGDSAEIKRVIKTLKKNMKDQEILIESSAKKADKLEREKKHFEDIKNRINLLLKDLESNRELSSLKQEQYNKIGGNIKESTKAVEVVKDNESSYKKYLKINEELQQLNKLVLSKEKDAKDLELSREKKVNLEKERDLKSNDIKNLKEKLISKNDDVAKISIEVEELKKEVLSFESEMKGREDSGKQFARINNKFKEHYELLKDSKDKLKSNESIIKTKFDMMGDVDLIDKELEKLEKSYSKMVEKRDGLDSARNSLSVENTKLEELKRAEESLKEGNCPILNERCEYIKSLGAPSDYFKSRKETLISAIKNIQIEIDKNSTVIKEIETLTAEKSKLENDKKNYLKIGDELTSLKKDSELISKDIKLKEKDIEILLSGSESNYKSLLYKGDYEAISDNMKAHLDDLRKDYEIIREKLNNSIKNKTGREEELSKIDNENNEIKLTIEKENKYLEELSPSIDRVKEKIENLEKQMEGIPEMKAEQEKLNNELQVLSSSYNLYMENLKKSEELEKYKKDSLTLEKEITDLDKKSKELNKNMADLESDFSIDDYERVVANLKDMGQSRDREQKELTEITSSLRIKEKELKDNEEMLCRISECKKDIETLDKKLTITEELRNNLNGMGKLVARRYMEKIEKKATENYRKITGKNHHIKWVNSNKESYSVFLSSGEDISTARKFEVLSGGEQVAVAISLRTAMSSLFTSTGFTIFDEPTINLDSERRYALAESMGEIFNNLQQAIIVTHDDTFREMAQKIIVLD